MTSVNHVYPSRFAMSLKSVKCPLLSWIYLTKCTFNRSIDVWLYRWPFYFIRRLGVKYVCSKWIHVLVVWIQVSSSINIILWIIVYPFVFSLGIFVSKSFRGRILTMPSIVRTTKLVVARSCLVGDPVFVFIIPERISMWKSSTFPTLWFMSIIFCLIFNRCVHNFT